MMMTKCKNSFGGYVLPCSILLLACVPAGGHTIDFDGLGNGEYVHNYYNGGSGRWDDPDDGTPSTVGAKSWGVTFDPDAQAFGSYLPDGSGNFPPGGNPSGDRIGAFLEMNSLGAVKMSVAGGFKDAFEFFYAATQPGKIEIFNAASVSLVSFDLVANNGGVQPILFSTWNKVNLSFQGTASYALFSGAKNTVGVDNITFTPVPDSGSTFGLAALALLGFAGLRRRF